MIRWVPLSTAQAFWVCCLAALLLGACGPAASAPTPRATFTPAPSATPASAPQPTGGVVAGPQVAIDNFTFTPRAMTVAPGTTVTWINRDDIPHTVTAQDHAFSAAALDTGDHFSHRFAAAGSYTYYCTIHPKMTAAIIVR